MTKMIIYLATDHAGFELKEKVKKFLTEKGYEVNHHTKRAPASQNDSARSGVVVKDLGALSYDEKDDYPDFVKLAAEAVSKCEIAASPSAPRNDECRAIVFGGSGQGEAMVANRYKGVRATVVYKFDRAIIKLSREHNNANVLSIGARFLGERKALKAVELWLATPFSGEVRHRRRIDKF